jgi:hypothetical protein
MLRPEASVQRQQNFSFWYVVAALILVATFQALQEERRRYEPITYATVERCLAERRIDEPVVSESRITGRIVDPAPGHPDFFATVRVDPAFADKLAAAGVEYRGSTEGGGFLGAPVEGGGRRFSEATAREIDLAVKRLIDHGYERATAIPSERREELARYAELLLERETPSASDLPPPRRAAA